MYIDRRAQTNIVIPLIERYYYTWVQIRFANISNDHFTNFDKYIYALYDTFQLFNYYITFKKTFHYDDIMMLLFCSGITSCCELMLIRFMIMRARSYVEGIESTNIVIPVSCCVDCQHNVYSPWIHTTTGPGLTNHHFTKINVSCILQLHLPVGNCFQGEMSPNHTEH